MQGSSIQHALQQAIDHAKMSPQREFRYYGPMSAILHSVYPLQESFLVYPQYMLQLSVRLVFALAAVGLQLILPQGVIPDCSPPPCT
jgi:hypothetical protein